AVIANQAGAWLSPDIPWAIRAGNQKAVPSLHAPMASGPARALPAPARIRPVEAPTVQPVRGTRDVLPPRRGAERALELRLHRAFALYGYEAIDTPVLEPAELFLRKHGEAIAGRMYTFSYWNRQLCLRPEFTASVIRAYLNQLQDKPLPLRVQYAGPTFRYARPQEEHHRQWTEVGAECVGASGPAADAEILALARQGLEAAGVTRASFA